MCNDLWVLQCNGESDSERKQRAKIVDHSWWIKMFRCCNVVQRDCEIMITLDLDFWLMLCIREEFCFRNVYVSILVGTKQLYTHKWFKKFRLETPFLNDNVKSKETRQNFKISKPVSLRYSIFFNKFCLFFIVVTNQSLHNDFGSRIWSKMSFTSHGIKKLTSR